MAGRARLRDLGIKIGNTLTGPNNAITDVPGVLVGQVNMNKETPAVHTGVTVIVPRGGEIGKDYAFAGFHRFNGCGEFTGIHWLEETGLLTSAIALTNTHQIGLVRDALSEFSFRHNEYGPFYLPVVGETYDGWLNDASAPGLTKEHVFEAMQSAKGGPVSEGNTGGGTGMICYDFKGGTGTASRRVQLNFGEYIIGVLVQANHGDRQQLRVDGVPVGREIDLNRVPSPWKSPPPSSSILIVVATDAPLLPQQCQRLAQRATVGLSRTGSVGHNSSGDLFLAFATGQHIPAASEKPFQLGVMIPSNQLNPFFEAVAEAVEEAILNVLTAAETLRGNQGHIAHALPLNDLQQVMNKYNRLQGQD